MNRIQNVCSLSRRLASRLLMESPLVAAHVHVYTRPMSPLVYLITTRYDPTISSCAGCMSSVYMPMALTERENNTPHVRLYSALLGCGARRGSPIHPEASLIHCSHTGAAMLSHQCNVFTLPDVVYSVFVCGIFPWSTDIYPQA